MQCTCAGRGTLGGPFPFCRCVFNPWFQKHTHCLLPSAAKQPRLEHATVRSSQIQKKSPSKTQQTQKSDISRNPGPGFNTLASPSFPFFWPESGREAPGPRTFVPSLFCAFPFLTVDSRLSCLSTGHRS